MSFTTSRASTTSTRCSVMTNTARCWRKRPSTQTAPFSATASSPGSTATSRPSSWCGSTTAPRSTFPCPTPRTSDTILFAAAYAGSSASARCAAARSGTARQVPPTPFSDSANCFGGSANSTPRPDRSGSGVSRGAFRRSAPIRSSRLVLATVPPVELAEGLARHGRELALASPAVPARVDEAERQRRDEAAREPAGEPVQPPEAEHPPHQLHARPLPPRQQPAAHDLLPPGEDLVVQVDADGAHVGARAAQARGERQRAVRRRVAPGRQDDADGPRDDPAVAVPAAAPEDRAGVHAGAAPDAGERAPEDLVLELCRAAVVHDDDVQLALAARPVEVRRVGRDGLARGGAGEEPQEHRQVLPPRDELLDAHARDVDGRERRPHVGVALVRADDDA